MSGQCNGQVCTLLKLASYRELPQPNTAKLVFFSASAPTQKSVALAPSH